MESVKHQIEYKRLDEIRPYDDNPRRNDEAAKAVANSIKEFGFQSPIIVDRDGVIIAGHTRYKAARRLKLQEVPVIVAAELDPEKVKALRIADNSTGEVAEWDLQLLVQELTGIEYDMTDFGLNLQIKIDEEVKEDDFTAEPPEQPITQRGDIWLLGDHRVMCGDSTSPQDVERLMDGQLADLLLTDPPYNVNYQGSNGKKIENDNMAESQFRQFLLQAYSRAFDACRTGASAYIFHADTEGEAFRAMFREAGWGLHGCLVWVKNSLVLGHSDYQWQHEPCLYGWKPGANHYFINDRSQTTVIDGRSAAHEEGSVAGLGHQGAGAADGEAQQRDPLRQAAPQRGAPHHEAGGAVRQADQEQLPARADRAGPVRRQRFYADCLRAAEPEVLHHGV